MAGNAGQRAVIVVGAGPVGLSAALALRARGLDATILEAEPADRVRPGSRAIYVHGATLRLLEQLRPGLGFRLADHGVIWPTRRTLWHGREVFSRTYDAPLPPGKLPHFTSLPQVVAERLLLEECAAAGVEIVWDAPVVAVDVDADGVTVTSGSGTTGTGATWTAGYVIGADGARSAVRQAIGVELEGSRSTNSYVIVDVAEVPESEGPLPLARVFHYEHPDAAGRNVLLVPFAGGWRADLQCRVDDDPEEFSGTDGAAGWVGASLGERYADRITWVSTYQFLQVIARRFVDDRGRVLLTGEAAHLFAPFGARGMNSGIPDADAAAGAVAAALASGSDAASAGAGRRHLRARPPRRRRVEPCRRRAGARAPPAAPLVGPGPPRGRGDARATPGGPASGSTPRPTAPEATPRRPRRASRPGTDSRARPASPRYPAPRSRSDRSSGRREAGDEPAW